MTPGERIRAARVQAGLSQAQLGAAAAVSRTTVLRWEYGTMTPSVRSLMKVAAALGVPVAAFFPSAPVPEPEPEPGRHDLADDLDVSWPQRPGGTVVLTHAPTGMTAAGAGLAGYAAAMADLCLQLVTAGRISENGARRAMGLPEWRRAA